jgi:hypothetical protein
MLSTTKKGMAMNTPVEEEENVPSVVVRVPDEVKGEFKSLSRYTAKYSSPFEGMDIGWMLIVMGEVVATGVAFGVFASIGLWEFGFAPLLLGGATLGAIEGAKRYSYRKHLRRVFLIHSLRKQLARVIKRSYGYDIKAIKSSYSWDYSSVEKLESFAAKILDGQAIKVKPIHRDRYGYSDWDYNDSFIKGIDKETHNAENLHLGYNPATSELVVYSSGRKPLTPTSSAPINALASAKKPAQKAIESNTKKEVVQLPKLSTKEFDFTSYPKSLQKVVGTTIQSYGKVSGLNLSVEEAYTAERAVRDLKDAVRLYEQIRSLGGPNAEETAVAIIDKLSDELDTIAKVKLDEAVSALERHRTYVSSREVTEETNAVSALS